MFKKLTLAKAQATIKAITAVNSVLMELHGRLCAIRYRAKEVVEQIEKPDPVTVSSGLYVMPSTPSYAIGSPYTLGINSTPSIITVNSAQNKKVMEITKDGDVEWYGKPSEAARIMVRSLQLQVETTKGTTKATKRRYYYLACKNLLNKSKTMKHEEFVDFLEKQVYNRESKIIWDALSNEN
jgi:hypothetical protein